MKIWFRLRESINLFRLLAKKGYLCLYQLGIMVIALWTLASLAITYRKVFLNPFEALTVDEMPAIDQGWFAAMMTNIVSSGSKPDYRKGSFVLADLDSTIFIYPARNTEPEAISTIPI